MEKAASSSESLEKTCVLAKVNRGTDEQEKMWRFSLLTTHDKHTTALTVIPTAHPGDSTQLVINTDNK